MMDEVRSHVGVPRFLLERFANKDGNVAVMDLDRRRTFYSSPSNAGVEKGYYDPDAEHFMSVLVEKPFCLLLRKLDEASSIYEKTTLLRKQKECVANFLKIQYFRSKKNLSQINNEAYSALIGQYSGSDMAKLGFVLSFNPIQLLEQPVEYFIFETNGVNFINSSLGFFFGYEFINELKEIVRYIFIPISSSEAILVTHSFGKTSRNYAAGPDDREYLHKQCLLFENRQGNGFVFAKDIEDFS